MLNRDYMQPENSIPAKSVLVVIPCFNEAKNIKMVIQNIKKCAPDVDYLIVNDCSTDNTADLCEKNGFNYINLPINLGIGGCVQTGYKYALQRDYDIAIQHDGDGQHDPRYFNDVILPILAGEADVVIGSRFIGKEGFQSTRLRRVGIIFLSNLIRFCAGGVVNVRDVTSGYRAVNRKYINLYAANYAQDYPEPEAIMYAALHKAKIVEVPVSMKERQEGKSSINSWKSLYYMLKVSISILLHRLTHTDTIEG